MNMSERGRLGGIARNGTTMAQHRRDVEECRAYLAAHPGFGGCTPEGDQKEISGVHPTVGDLDPSPLESIHPTDGGIT